MTKCEYIRTSLTLGYTLADYAATLAGIPRAQRELWAIAANIGGN